MPGRDCREEKNRRTAKKIVFIIYLPLCVSVCARWRRASSFQRAAPSGKVLLDSHSPMDARSARASVEKLRSFNGKGWVFCGAVVDLKK